MLVVVAIINVLELAKTFITRIRPISRKIIFLTIFYCPLITVLEIAVSMTIAELINLFKLANPQGIAKKSRLFRNPLQNSHARTFLYSISLFQKYVSIMLTFFKYMLTIVHHV